MIDQIIHNVKSDFCHPVSSFAANQFKQFVESEVSKNPSFASILEQYENFSKADLLSACSLQDEKTSFEMAAIFLRIAEIENNSVPMSLPIANCYFQRYKNVRNSNVAGYICFDSGIAIVFRDEEYVYLYDYSRSGFRAVEHMKGCAKKGSELNAFANRKNFHDGNFRKILLSGRPLYIG